MVHGMHAAIIPLAMVTCLALASCVNPTQSGSGSSQSPSTAIRAMVLDSPNGSSIAGAIVEVSGAAGPAIGSYTTAADGSLDLTSTLSAGAVYSMQASAAGRATSALLDFTATAGTTLSLYCHSLAMTNVTPAAPRLVSLEYSTNGGTTWASWDPLVAAPTFASGFQVRVAVAGVVAIEPTSWSGFGVKVDLDHMPTLDNGSYPTKYPQKSQLDSSGDAWNGLYVTEVLFDFSGASLSSGTHRLDLVAYDVANDRLEIDLPFSLSSPAVGGSSLASATFSSLYLDLQSYGRSANLFSLSPRTGGRVLGTSASPSSYVSRISFYLQQNGSPASILGFDVYRSTNSFTFSKVARVNLGRLRSTTDLNSAFSYSDYDPTLALGTTYYYKVVAFSDDSNFSPYSPVLWSRFLPPFTLSLVSPADGSSLASTPNLAFSISSQSLWSGAQSAYFNFSLFVRDKAGATVFYGEYRYDFATGRFEAPGSYGSDGVADWTSPIAASGLSYSNGTITINPALACAATFDDATATGSRIALSLSSGQTYEWEIFGDWLGSSYGAVGSSTAMDSASFLAAGSTGSLSASYANTYEGGEGSLNGSFSFTRQ